MNFPLLALSSFWLGALHALEPGHGKTVVGAYLIGSKGRTIDAVLLGIVVTLTHTGVVLVLGVLSAMAAAYFVPETVQKVLEVVSGLLVLGVGAWMIGVRVRQARRGHREHGHSDAQGHSHDHGQDSHEHPHNDKLTHDGPKAHAHGQDAHGFGNDHRGHDHRPGHSHAPEVKLGQRPTLWQLIALGVSGGIIPCPAALAVLLAAISFGRMAQGVSLVIVFSVGMAVVLVAIGIAMVKAAKFASGYVAENKWTRIVPVISAVIVTLLGLVLTINAFVAVL